MQELFLSFIYSCPTNKQQQNHLLHCHLLIHAEIHIYLLGKYWHNDKRCIKEDARGRHRKKRRRKSSLQKYSPLTLLQGFEKLACERMMETEHKLHILTPLLWPSRCVFLVLLMLGSTPLGLSEGPLGLVWPSLPHLVSNPLGVCWQLLRGFSECPLGRVWPSLPHLVSGCLEVCWQLPWDPNSTELNNNSTPTRSPTGSLKSNV